MALGHIFGIAKTAGCGHRDCENAQDRFRPLVLRRCLVAEAEHRTRQTASYTDRRFGGILGTARWHLEQGGPISFTKTGGLGPFDADRVVEVGDDTITFESGERWNTYSASAVASIRSAER